MNENINDDNKIDVSNAIVDEDNDVEDEEVEEMEEEE
jgi:hypothetical protein